MTLCYAFSIGNEDKDSQNDISTNTSKNIWFIMPLIILPMLSTAFGLYAKYSLQGTQSRLAELQFDIKEALNLNDLLELGEDQYPRFYPMDMAQMDMMGRSSPRLFLPPPPADHDLSQVIRSRSPNQQA